MAHPLLASQSLSDDDDGLTVFICHFLLYKRYKNGPVKRMVEITARKIKHFNFRMNLPFKSYRHPPPLRLLHYIY